jgi:predicted ATPase/DNA-binding winged helix-turn-helix (wHTH) protein
MNTESLKTITIGSCELSLAHRQLTRAGRVILLGSRAFDVLLCLIERKGEVVSKQELISLVWPRREADENTLEAAVSSLCRALGPDRLAISTVAGRGYRFIESRRGELVDSATLGMVSLPATLSRLIGRNSALEELMTLAARSRLITLVGAGGIGKTRLAVELARHLSDGTYDRVCIAELAQISRDEFLPITIASAMGFTPIDGQISIEPLSEFLRKKRSLLILDNCEHLIQASASLVDALLRATPSLQLIATSREALRVEGEQIYQVSALEVPVAADEDQQSIAEYSAVQLLEARLSRGQVPYSADPSSASMKANICRRLDGIPLAIELAAARVDVFGLAGVWAGLEHAFDILTAGSRTSQARQRTLAATLGWSYDLLPADEQTVLTRLSVFSAQFSLEAAIAVVATPSIPAAEVLDFVVNLVSKSLVSSATRNAETSYRLLEMTRAYAMEKLLESHEAAVFLERHAQYFRDLLQSATGKSDQPTTDTYMAQVETHVKDLRAALRWCFSERGNTTLGIELTTAALPYWTDRSLVIECRQNLTRALEHLETRTVVDHRPDQSSEQLDEIYQTLAATWTLWAMDNMSGAFHECADLAQRFGFLLSNQKNERTPTATCKRISD